MAKIQTARQLFLQELADILFVENTLAEKVLPELHEEVADEEFRGGLEKHVEQTRQHAERVEEVFDLFGEKPQAEKCEGLEGLRKEHDEMADNLEPELADVFDAGAAAKTEHYEIAAYEALIEMARAMGEREAVGLLEENLKEEKETLREVQSISKRLSKEIAERVSA
jgi:ferritin-like metal-binding protein YciE